MDTLRGSGSVCMSLWLKHMIRPCTYGPLNLSTNENWRICSLQRGLANTCNVTREVVGTLGSKTGIQTSEYLLGPLPVPRTAWQVGRL
jgi:hypothetical protein